MRAPSNDADARPEEESQTVFRRPRMDIGRGRLRRRPGLRAFDALLDQRLGFADRQVTGDHIARDAQDVRLAGERQKRAGVAHREAARRDFVPDFAGSFSSLR